MADIAPFRGIRYDRQRVDVSQVLAPPYDVIDADQRAALAAANPHNVVQLILPEAEADGGDRYQHAAALLDAWLGDGTLVRDASRSIYRYHQSFRSVEHGGRLITRRGFVAAVRLEPFSAGVVLPHERTLAAPKKDRLALMTATRAHLSQIFGLFQDPGGEVERLFRRIDDRAADVEATTGDGVQHRLWQVTDAELIGKVRRLFAPKKVYIADGHHRYETMLALRNRIAAETPLGQYSAAQYASMFLVATDNPGLVVYPTHRIVHGLAALDAASFLQRARDYFVVERLPGAARDGDRIRDAIAHTPGHQPSFAAVFAGDADAWQLTLNPHVNPASVGLSGHPALLRLDVTLLHGLVLNRILGITAAAQESQSHLRYVKDTATVLADIGASKGQVAFLLNPGRVEQVRQVADAGEVMPQKSTFFYPKLASGIVMARIDPDEDLI